MSWLALGACVLLGAVRAQTLGDALACGARGPSTRGEAHGVPLAAGVCVSPLLTVGEQCEGGAFERLAGVVDGLGALLDPTNAYAAALRAPARRCAHARCAAVRACCSLSTTKSRAIWAGRARTAPAARS